ncbi:MAG: binding 4 protein [Patescibacteria group bacterium]|nr:binding 4 protein [Patescibacteria group bacterium]
MSILLYSEIMGIIRYLTVLVLFLVSATPALASEIDLGLFSPSFLENKASDIVLLIDRKEYKLPKQELGKWLRENSSLAYNPSYLSEIENGDLCDRKKPIDCEISFSLKRGSHIQKKSFMKLDKDQAESFIKDLARSVNKDPEDAKLKMEEGRVSIFSLSKPGLKLDEEKSLLAMVEYIKNPDTKDPLELPFEKINPEVSIDSIDNMGVTSLIGEGRSNFRGSPKNRVFNIKVATNRFNGMLIKPGEEFSFVKILGEVDGEHGYLPELVIKKDKTEPEFGGGICQVSTTAFRAAINAGLEITARRNHAYPVSYYNPQGMDATVYVPKPDLRFKNDTPGYILIQTRIEGTELIFNFYGTNDGRKVEIDGPTVLERNPDGSMKTVFTQKVYDDSSSLIREDVFNSSYDSPSKYPHPATSSDILTEKPNGWSDKEWKEYKKAHWM